MQPLAPAPAPPVALGALPLAFVPNRGQGDPVVAFQAQGLGGALAFSAGGVALTLPGGSRLAPGSVAVQVRFAQANRAPALSGQQRLPGVVNYFFGDDPAAWHTGLPTYATLVYSGLYEGIDLRYDGQRQALKGTFSVAPGADPQRIRWSYEGSQSVQIDPQSGDLRINLPGGAGHLTEQAPVAWQDVAGQRRAVPARYQLFADGSVGFALGQYDARQPLTIDPTLIYSSYLGGSGSDYGRGIALDSSGNIYVAGATNSPNFPLRSPLSSHAGGYDLFVTKLDPSGTALIYSSYLGGAGDDLATDLALDPNGNAYLTGSTTSANFPVHNAYDQNYNGSRDAFLLKIGAAGAALFYSTYLGTSRNDEGLSIALDSSNRAHVAGTTEGTTSEFPLVKPVQTSNGGGSDLFVTRFSFDGGGTSFSTLLGGNNNEQARGVAVASDGHIYLTGWSASANFPRVPSTLPTHGGARDAIVVELDPVTTDATRRIVLSRYLGGSSNDQGNSIVLDANKSMYVIGHSSSTNFPTTSGALYKTLSGASDAFITRLTPSGQTLTISSYLGGSDSEEGNDLALDSAGNMVLVGRTASANFPLSNALQGSRSGVADAFVAKMNSAGSTLMFSSYLGGVGDDGAARVALDSGLGVYLTGYTYSHDFPTERPYQGSAGGGQDAFVSRINVDRTRADVRLRDTAGDTGSEPQPRDLPLWASPDILPCADRNCTQAQNPVTGQTNYVYVTLRNDGPKAIPPQPTSGTLILYYTRSGGAARWPTDWTTIGQASAVLAAGQALTVELPWANVPAAGHYCLLARWVSSNDPMNGAETINTLENTRNNNNIAWRNLNVINIPRGGSAQSSLAVRNIDDAPKAIDLAITPSGASFLSQGTIVVDLGTELFNGWDQGGRQGSNITAVGGTSVELTDPTAGGELRYVVLGERRSPELALSFRARADAAPGTYTVYVRQYVQDAAGRTEVGGVGYSVTVAP